MTHTQETAQTNVTEQNRWENIRETVSEGAANLFGIVDAENTSAPLPTDPNAVASHDRGGRT